MNTQNQMFLTTSEVALIVIYRRLWRFLPHKSFISGNWLRVFEQSADWRNCFVHVLPEEYHYFEHYAGNIIICTPEERELWLTGTEEQRITYALNIEEKTRGKMTARWDAVKELSNELKKLYKQSFPTTHGMLVNYYYNNSEHQQILGKLNHKFWNSLKFDRTN